MKQSSVRTLTIFLAATVIVYLVFVFLLYTVESGSDKSNLKSLTDVFWYSLVTFTTVGYGDYFPVTGPGKIIGVLFVIGSVCVIGIIVGKITEKINEIREKKKMGHNGTDFSGHVIILGWNNFAKMIVHQLLLAKNKVVIVTAEKNDIDLIWTEYPNHQASIFLLFSELSNVDMLAKANIEHSKVVFVNQEQDTDKLITILNIKETYHNLRFLVALENYELYNTFKSAGVDHILSKNEIASKLIASYIFEPDVAEFTADVITSSEASDEYDIKQYKIKNGNRFDGKTYGEVFEELKRQHNILAIGICKIENGNKNLLKLPEDNVLLKAGDYLLMIVNGSHLQKLGKLFEINEGVVNEG